MRVTHGPSTGGAWVLTVVLVATACSTPGSHPRSPGLEHQLQELALVAERDSLQMEVAATGKLLGDIEGELARALPVPPATGTPESPTLEITKDRRSFTLDRVREVASRLKSTEARLATSERRVRKLTQSVDTLTEGMAMARIAAAQLAEEVGTQRLTIDGLTARVEGLLTENMALADSVYHLTDRQSTAYYVVGTRQELLSRGVLVADGHRAIPLVGRRSVTPARELPLQEFTSINWSETREIPLPHPNRHYRIVSRQNLASLASWVGNQGAVKGTIAITAPESFWEPSKYLIVVEQ
ncbi:MAG: hypothetical protein ABI587_11040 [Gemmatimonadales bacterium]